jgi:hypothetical protein
MEPTQSLPKPAVRSARITAVRNPKLSKEELSRRIKKMRDRDSELVTGIFKNFDNPSSSNGLGALIFTFKLYPGDENVTYELWDGERYTIPRSVVHHLNNRCYYKEYYHMKNEFGDNTMRRAAPDGRYHVEGMQACKKKPRFAFLPLEYMDNEDADMLPAADLVEVTKV